MDRTLNLLKNALAAFAVCGMIAACGTPGGTIPGEHPVTVQQDVLYKAHLVFQGLLHTEVALQAAGKLKGDNLNKAIALNTAIKTALDAGKVVEANSLISQLKLVIGE